MKILKELWPTSGGKKDMGNVVSIGTNGRGFTSLKNKVEWVIKALGNLIFLYLPNKGGDLLKISIY